MLLSFCLHYSLPFLSNRSKHVLISLGHDQKLVRINLTDQVSLVFPNLYQWIFILSQGFLHFFFQTLAPLRLKWRNNLMFYSVAQFGCGKWNTEYYVDYHGGISIEKKKGLFWGLSVNKNSSRLSYLQKALMFCYDRFVWSVILRALTEFHHSWARPCE